MNQSDILFIATRLSTIRKFYNTLIDDLSAHGYSVNIAGTNDLGNFSFRLNDLWQTNLHNINISRSFISANHLFSIIQIFYLIKKLRPRIIFVTTPVAAAVLRICPINFKKMRVKIIYAAHGFHFYRGAPAINWLIYFPIEYFLSMRTHLIITTNEEDYNMVNRLFRSTHVHKIYGIGLNILTFNDDKKTDYISRILRTKQNEKIIISVGELNKNKNHAVLIPYLSRREFKHLHYVICGSGKLANYLVQMANKHGVSDRVHLLGYRDDISQLLSGADLFFFPSLREGFGMSLVEAIAMKKDFVASKIRGVVDIVPLEMQDHHLFNVKDDIKMIKLISEKLIHGVARDVSHYLRDNMYSEIINDQYLELIKEIDDNRIE
jgi:glycosyltransferase involved in cell wall biosynthesis